MLAAFQWRLAAHLLLFALLPSLRRVPEVLDAIVGPRVNGTHTCRSAKEQSSERPATHLPGRSLAISAHLFPFSLCACVMISSSSGLHGPFLMDGSRWFSHRVRHCLPVRVMGPSFLLLRCSDITLLVTAARRRVCRQRISNGLDWTRAVLGERLPQSMCGIWDPQNGCHRVQASPKIMPAGLGKPPQRQERCQRSRRRRPC